MNDLGSVNDILRINIKRDGPTGKMRLTQRRYITDMLQTFEMEDCKPISTLFEPNQKLTKEMQSEEERISMKHKPYRELTGSLIYLANATRSDLHFLLMH